MWEDKKHIANRDLHQAKGLLERQQNEKPKIENELEKCEEELKRVNFFLGGEFNDKKI